MSDSRDCRETLPKPIAETFRTQLRQNGLGRAAEASQSPGPPSSQTDATRDARCLHRIVPKSRLGGQARLLLWSRGGQTRHQFNSFNGLRVRCARPVPLRPRGRKFRRRKHVEAQGVVYHDHQQRYILWSSH